MIVIRIVKGIKDHFSIRVAEWGLAVILINWGLRLIFPDNVFQSDVSFSSMETFFSETFWAFYCIIVGVLRLLSLTINGTFRNTIYAKYSPLCRGTMASLSCLFWSQILISIITVVPLSPHFAVYSVLLALDIYCVATTLNEAGKQVA
jgi:hypothetical protein